MPDVFGGGGVRDHGKLTGLLDDDHPQYLLIDGTRAMTGSLNMGAQSIANTNLTDGRVVFTGNGGDLETDAGLTYNFTTDSLTVVGPISAGSFFGGNLTAGRVAVVAASGLITDDPGLTFNTTTNDLTVTGSISGSQLTATSLTLNSVVFVGTGGILSQDNTNFTFDDATNKLFCGGAIECDGTLRCDSTVGIQTAPVSATLIISTVNGSTVTQGAAIDLTYTGSANPAAGVNVLNFIVTDQSTSGSATIFRAIKAISEFDRGTMPTSNMQHCIDITGYGVRAASAMSSGTYDWRGLKIKQTDPNNAANITGGNFTTIDIETESINHTRWTGATSFTHYAAKFGSRIWTNETISKASGVTDADGICANMKLQPAYTRASGIGTYTITRHNYIELLNIPPSTGVAITDACVFRFDAAAGTHNALDAGTTKASPGTVDAWVLINHNGTVMYMPAYNSKTT